MLVIRSLIFNILFYINTIGILIFCTPVYFILPHNGSMAIVRWWGRSSLWMAKVICGLKHEFRGAENIPKGGYLAGVKHQSIWETFALLSVIPDPATIIKKQLLYVPVWGWWAWKASMIFVDRGKGSAAIKQILTGSKRELAKGRPIMIFPEGTRRTPGAPPDYKLGISVLYRSLKVPVLPIALNSGLFWPRRKFLRYPGTIVVEFLPPIQPGLDQQAFLSRLQETIEAASDRLLLEAARSAEPPPLPPEAERRIGELVGAAA
jgi:1-acyl-sn-glycerol-3-phosphate acyltransferase